MFSNHNKNLIPFANTKFVKEIYNGQDQVLGFHNSKGIDYSGLATTQNVSYTPGISTGSFAGFSAWFNGGSNDNYLKFKYPLIELKFSITSVHGDPFTEKHLCNIYIEDSNGQALIRPIQIHCVQKYAYLDDYRYKMAIEWYTHNFPVSGDHTVDAEFGVYSNPGGNLFSAWPIYVTINLATKKVTCTYGKGTCAQDSKWYDNTFNSLTHDLAEGYNFDNGVFIKIKESYLSPGFSIEGRNLYVSNTSSEQYLMTLQK